MEEDEDETWSVTRKDTLFLWTVDEVADKLEENGWSHEDGFWFCPSGHSPRCFKDRLLQDHPNWVAYWFLEIAGIFPDKGVEVDD